jgi:hypothetical protein
MTDTATGFGPHERRYFKRLETALLLAPRRERSGMLEVARRHMAERPPAASYDELVDEAGPPEAYALQLMADAGVDPQPPRWRRLAARARSREAIAATLVAVLVVGAGLWFLASWFTEEPTIQNNCAGAHSPNPTVPIEIVDAAGVTERRIGYVDGAEVQLFLCLTASDTVEVTGIEVPTADISLFQQRDVLLIPAGAGGELEDPSTFEPFTIVPGTASSEPDPRSFWQVYVTGILADCEYFSEGISSSFDTATLTYRFRGRSRTMPIDMLATYSFDGGTDDACPRARGAGS